MMNLNKLAKMITLMESGKKQISIAQVKEVMRHLLTILARTEPLELFKILKRYEN